MKIDLHAHSRASDGTLTPAELVERAHNLHVDVLALTDHDSISGLTEARERAEQLGSPQIVSGIEFSCQWHSFEIHVLGWNFNPADAQLTALIEQQRLARRQRAEQIRDKLLKRGIASQALEFVEQAHQNRGVVVTRRHFAEALVSAGVVPNIEQAFKRYLGKGQSAYVKPAWCSIDEAVQAIRVAEGTSGLAHPLAYALSAKWLKRLLTDFKSADGHAIEVVSTQQTPAHRQYLAELATQFGFTASVGSDFHFPGPWRELGRNLRVPDGCTPAWQNWAVARQFSVEN